MVGKQLSLFCPALRSTPVDWTVLAHAALETISKSIPQADRVAAVAHSLRIRGSTQLNVEQRSAIATVLLRCEGLSRRPGASPRGAAQSKPLDDFNEWLGPVPGVLYGPPGGREAGVNEKLNA